MAYQEGIDHYYDAKAEEIELSTSICHMRLRDWLNALTSLSTVILSYLCFQPFQSYKDLRKTWKKKSKRKSYSLPRSKYVSSCTDDFYEELRGLFNTNEGHFIVPWIKGLDKAKTTCDWSRNVTWTYNATSWFPCFAREIVRLERVWIGVVESQLSVRLWACYLD